MGRNHESVDCRKMLYTTNKSKEFGCRYLISPYIGCEFRCAHCSGCPGYLELRDYKESIGKIQVKLNAPAVLKRELKSSKKGVVCVSGYQLVEKEFRLVRKCLEILEARRFPVHVMTISNIVLDDLDLLSRISENSWFAVSFRIMTMDDEISNIFEQDAPSPKVRMKAIGKLVEAGVITGIAPLTIIPYINDSEEQLDDLIKSASNTNVGYIVPKILSLDDNLRAEFIKVIKRNYPELLIKYRRLYEFGSTPEVKYSKQVKNRIISLLKKYEITDSIPQYYPKNRITQVNIEDFLQKRRK